MEPGCAPRLMRWGASDEEVSGPYPGAEIVPHGERGTTMAVTINAPRTGCGRGWSNWVGTAAVGTPGTISTTPVGQVHEKSTLTGKTSPLATLSNTGHAAAGQWTRGQLQRLNPTDSWGCTA